MSAVPAASFNDILQALIDQLVSVMEFGKSQVIPDARDDDDTDFKIAADQYVIVRIGAAKIWPTHEGAGRNALTFERQIQCILWTRMATDPGPSDDRWLMDQTRGHIAAEEALYNALTDFQPLDEDGNWLVVQPIDPQPVTAPKKSKRRKVSGWGRSGVQFGIVYTLAAIDTTYQ